MRLLLWTPKEARPAQFWTLRSQVLEAETLSQMEMLNLGA